MQFKGKIIIFLFILTFSVFMGNIILADETEDAPCTDPKTCFPNPLGSSVTPQILMGRVINAVLGIVGSIALVMFIYGGFVWMTAAGNQESVTKGRNILIWATVGLIVIFSAYALVNFVFKAIGG
jgi:hypothetical protein